MTFRTFLRDNRRWLLGGMTLTLFSGAGQTYYIALYAGAIRSDFGLSHGDFGLLYMAATLASALTLVWLGRVVDVYSVRGSASVVIVLLALASVLMATAESLVALGLAIYALRLLGQGMMSHIAITAMARWFLAERGRAVAVASTGFQIGEGILPLSIVALLTWFDWRTAWWLTAVALLACALPIARIGFAFGRQLGGLAGSIAGHPAGYLEESGRQWQRAEVLRDLPFWLVCSSVLAPAFIGTSVFFHQVHISDTKGWPPGVMAGAFALMALATVAVGLLTGQLVDRFSARRLLPVFLVPLSLACLVLAQLDAPAAALLFMGLLGVSYGISTTLFGAVWPEIYGTRHLGAIRSVVFAAMVFASALGPGLTGWLIDRGVAFERQLVFMAAYCLLSIGVLIPVSRYLRNRSLAPAIVD